MTTLPLSNWKRSGEVVAVAVFAVEQQSRSLFKIETNAQGKRKKKTKSGSTYTHKEGEVLISLPFGVVVVVGGKTRKEEEEENSC
jgi:hypothetical protein